MIAAVECVRAGRYWTRSRRRSAACSAARRPVSPPETSTWDMAAAMAAMAGVLGDEAPHGLADAPVRGVPLRRGAQLDHVHRLAGVEVHVEADAIGHGHGIGRDVGQARAVERVVHRRRLVHHAHPVGGEARLAELLRHHVAVARRQPLPFEREQPVALEIAEGAVVAEDVEAIAGALEGAAGLVAPVLSPADVGGEHLGALGRAELSRDGEELVVGQIRDGVERGGHHLHLAVRVEVGERHLAARRGLDAVEEPPRHGDRLLPGPREIAAPRAAALGAHEAAEEGGDDLAELDEHRLRAVAHLAQGVRAHAQQERLVALAGAEDADIGPGGRGQEPARAVEGLGADGRAPGGVALARRPRNARAPVLAHEIDDSAHRSRRRGRGRGRSAAAAGGRPARRARGT